MRLKEDAKLVELLSYSKMCKEDVFFKTEEGDVLNLKSLLSAMLLQSLANDASLIARGKIVCMNESDYEILSDFLEN
ncbi:hypothetical protein [Konateibacter massiliensis]|uniref:hypothetical protein n=1 Tax=Konateibacter massiliensis TaxID=2002841 RepID=UPI000C14FE90|nr:hypothetical protein [Konateibacter massiliensis]